MTTFEKGVISRVAHFPFSLDILNGLCRTVHADIGHVGALFDEGKPFYKIHKGVTIMLNNYKVRHVACNMQDFYADRHRFRFEYNKKTYIASCYGTLSVFFEDDAMKEVPPQVQEEVQEKIWYEIDHHEKKWRYPAEAYAYADNYCEQELKVAVS